MAYLISDAQLRLANRLGENAVPAVISEATKRRNWFSEAKSVIYSKKPLWFSQTRATQSTIANRPDYSFPADLRRELMIYVDGYKYQKIDLNKLDEYQNSLTPVAVLPSSYEYCYYTMGDKFYLMPTPTAVPSSFSITSITRSDTTATVTTAESHNLVTNDYVNILGADQTDYNGKKQITYLTATTFSFTVVNTAVTPATGTLTATKDNIEVWYLANPTAYTADADSITIPDKYINALVSYAEGRYWSSAHKRGKAADAFTEFENIINDMVAEDHRKSFYTGLL